MQPVQNRRELARHLFASSRSNRPVDLSPAPVPSISFEQHLLSRATFGVTPPLLQEVASQGIDSWLFQQLHPESIDDSAAEALVASSLEPWRAAAADTHLLIRALWSKRQLAWWMVHFLNNHFSTYRGDTASVSETNEDLLFYKTCFGDFATVLRISATSPAMIDYLDSVSNVAGRPNENYARELLELHTLGVNGGYTEPDVAEVARVFTGWSRTRVSTPGGPVTDSWFRFRAANHDSGAKVLSLGWSTPGIAGANGFQEGYDLLAFLAAHPSTATFFVGKLCQYFVADQPPAGLLARVRQAFVSSNGSLRQTVFAIFTDPEFGLAANIATKVHDGFELLVNMIRRLEIPPAQSFNNQMANLINRVGMLRARPHENPVPTGYPEVGTAWQGASNLLSRWLVADDLANNRIGGSGIPWTALFPTRPPNGTAWVAALLQRLLHAEVPLSTATALALFIDNRLATLPANPTFAQILPHLRELASLVLRLPEAQLH